MSESGGRKALNELLHRHPAQRFNSPSRTISAALHATGLVSFVFSYKFLIENPNVISESYGWHFQFLTIIGLSLATVTFATAFIADITMSSGLFLVKNALGVASAPMEVLISILYWGLCVVDPSLVRADFLPELPMYADIGMHATPAVLLVIDILFFSPPWSISAIPALCLSGVLATAYWFWIEHCHSVNGFYPYPLFDLEPPLRIGLFAGSALVMTLSTISLQALYSQVNGHGILSETSKKTR